VSAGAAQLPPPWLDRAAYAIARLDDAVDELVAIALCAESHQGAADPAVLQRALRSIGTEAREAVERLQDTNNPKGQEHHDVSRRR
jgi:hypothetical protein